MRCRIISWISLRSCATCLALRRRRRRDFPSNRLGGWCCLLDFENKFMDYMDQFSFNKDLLSKLRTKLKDKLGKATANEQKDGRKLRTHIQELTERQNTLIKKNLDGFISDTILKQQLDLIEKELTDAQINLASMKEMEIDFDEVLGFVSHYLENPSTVWKDAKLEKQLKLQWFQFPQGIVYENGNYGTAQLACIFKTNRLPIGSLRAGSSGVNKVSYD